MSGFKRSRDKLTRGHVAEQVHLKAAELIAMTYTNVAAA